MRLAPAARRALRRLARHPRAAVFVISGRRAKTAACGGVPRHGRYFGMYGWERSGRAPLPRYLHRPAHCRGGAFPASFLCAGPVGGKQKNQPVGPLLGRAQSGETSRPAQASLAAASISEISSRHRKYSGRGNCPPACIFGKKSHVVALAASEARALPRHRIYCWSDLSGRPLFEAVREHISLESARRATTQRAVPYAGRRRVANARESEAALN